MHLKKTHTCILWRLVSCRAFAHNAIKTYLYKQHSIYIYISNTSFITVCAYQQNTRRRVSFLCVCNECVIIVRFAGVLARTEVGSGTKPAHVDDSLRDHVLELRSTVSFELRGWVVVCEKLQTFTSKHPLVILVLCWRFSSLIMSLLRIVGKEVKTLYTLASYSYWLKPVYSNSINCVCVKGNWKWLDSTFVCLIETLFLAY